MNNLIAAYAVAWSILMILVWTIASRQRQLQRSLDTFRQQRESNRTSASHGR